jgi:PHD/YefM family antitoxin component YafN of YafNO toxin-antitoxin module
LQAARRLAVGGAAIATLTRVRVDRSRDVGVVDTGHLTYELSGVMSECMKELNAVDLRGSLKTLARSLERDGEPILLKLGRKPVGVIVSLSDFRERFALEAAKDERRRLLEEILTDRLTDAEPVDEILSGLRNR